MDKYVTINNYVFEANKPPETTLILEHGEDGSTAVPVDPEEDREAWTPWEVSLQGCHSISCIGGCIRLYPLAVSAVSGCIHWLYWLYQLAEMRMQHWDSEWS